MEIQSKKQNQRFWWIDVLRGMAVLGMMVFHLFFILDFFDVLSQQMYQGVWLMLARLVQFTFLGLVGVSLAISKKGKVEQLLRGLKILGLGLIVTLVTSIFVPGQFVIFGILHLIGTSVILLSPLRQSPYLALALGIFAFFLSEKTTSLYTTFKPLYILGFQSPVNISAIDYFPIFPWISVVLLGLFVGHFVKQKKADESATVSKYFKPFIFFGKRSLLIYMIHVPLILLILILANLIELNKVI